MNLKKEIITKNGKETETLGESFAKSLKGGDVVCLYGDLGSGKTTFVKGLAKGLGIKSRIISPTFVIVRQHEISPSHKSDIRIMYHLDLYRLKTEQEVLGIDMKDLLEDKQAVTVIEWPEMGKNILKKNCWEITFEQINEDERKIKINR